MRKYLILSLLAGLAALAFGSGVNNPGGTVNTGTAGQVAFYPASTGAVSSTGTITMSGGILNIRPPADGITGINIQNASGGTTIMSIDTTNNRIAINNSGLAPSYDLQIGSTAPEAGQNTAVAVSKVIAINANAHGFADYSLFQGSNLTTRAYAAFDSKPDMNGSNNFDHVAGFQSAPSHTGSGTISNMYNYVAALGNSGGVCTNAFGLWLEEGGAGSGITNEYGIYIPALTLGGTIYPIYVADTTHPSFFGSGIKFNDSTVMTTAGTQIYQIVMASTTTGSATSNTTFTNTALTGTINNLTSGHHVRIRVHGTAIMSGTGSIFLTINAGTARNLGDSTLGFTDFTSPTNGLWVTPSSMEWTDNPLVTGTTSYTVAIRTNSGGNTVQFPRSSQPAIMELEEIP